MALAIRTLSDDLALGCAHYLRVLVGIDTRDVIPLSQMLVYAFGLHDSPPPSARYRSSAMRVSWLTEMVCCFALAYTFLRSAFETRTTSLLS
jgi:hypothetical protein